MTKQKSKPIVHTSRDGIKFWVDADLHMILTDRPNTYLDHVRYGPFSGVYKRLVLYLDNHPIEFAGPDGMPYEFQLERNPAGDPIMLTTWQFSSLGSRGDHFTSRAQQDLAVRLITDMLSNFNRDWIGAWHAEKQTATVEFSDGFQTALHEGRYIRED